MAVRRTTDSPNSGTLRGILFTDDNIAYEPHRGGNGLTITHYGHTSGQHVRGINFVGLLYQTS